MKKNKELLPTRTMQLQHDGLTEQHMIKLTMQEKSYRLHKGLTKIRQSLW